MPISMALTEYNVILLYEDRVRVIGLLSDKVVFEEVLNLVCMQSFEVRFFYFETNSRHFIE